MSASIFTTPRVMHAANATLTLALLCLYDIAVTEAMLHAKTEQFHNLSDERRRRHRMARDYNAQRNHRDPQTADKVFKLLEAATQLDVELNRLSEKCHKFSEHLTNLQAFFLSIVQWPNVQPQQIRVPLVIDNPSFAAAV